MQEAKSNLFACKSVEEFFFYFIHHSINLISKGKAQTENRGYSHFEHFEHFSGMSEQSIQLLDFVASLPAGDKHNEGHPI